MRDTNKRRVYSAEDNVRDSLKKARGATAVKHRDTVFASVSEAQSFLDDVLRPQHETAEQRKQFAFGVFEKPTVKAKVTTSTYYALGHKLAPGCAPAIGLYPGWGFTALVLAHEYTHHLVRLCGDANNVVRACPSHGSEFARLQIEVLRKSHGDHAAELLASAYEKQRVIFEPRAQRDAAHKQVLRLRSDVIGALSKRHADTIPITLAVYAKDPSDYSGDTYACTRDRLSLPSTYTNALAFGDEVEVEWRQLRYFEAPMVRDR